MGSRHVKGLSTPPVGGAHFFTPFPLVSFSASNPRATFPIPIPLQPHASPCWPCYQCWPDALPEQMDPPMVIGADMLVDGHDPERPAHVDVAGPDEVLRLKHESEQERGGVYRPFLSSKISAATALLSMNGTGYPSPSVNDSVSDSYMPLES
jgi:hypothetical protein